jgi:hypothetical protein
MARRSLDHSKPLNEVVGNDPTIPYRYMQAGRYFDDAGEEISKNGVAVTVEKVEAEPAPAAAPTEAEIQARIDAAVAAALAKAAPKNKGDTLKELAEETKGKK